MFVCYGGLPGRAGDLRAPRAPNTAKQFRRVEQHLARCCWSVSPDGGAATGRLVGDSVPRATPICVVMFAYVCLVVISS